tara:strand:- start:176 stop:667 length:492 start_codon:yes stop_codon:yes gene_type:complete
VNGQGETITEMVLGHLPEWGSLLDTSGAVDQKQKTLLAALIRKTSYMYGGLSEKSIISLTSGPLKSIPQLPEEFVLKLETLLSEVIEALIMLGDLQPDPDTRQKIYPIPPYIHQCANGDMILIGIGPGKRNSAPVEIDDQIVVDGYKRIIQTDAFVPDSVRIL